MSRFTDAPLATGPLAPAKAHATLAEAVGAVRTFLESAPSIDHLRRSRRRAFAGYHAVLPSTATPGEPVSMTVQAWDEYERLVPGFSGTASLAATDPDASLPGRIVFESGRDGTESGNKTDRDGVRRVEGITFETPGIHYVTLTTDDGGAFVSNPIEVREDPDHRLYWGDIHLHSQFSDGAGSVRKGLRFGRDVMDLDVVAYTDHDTMGFFIPPGLQRWLMHRRGFERSKEPAEAFNDPGSFVTLFGYEWTKQPTNGGHVNVYFESPERSVLFDSRHPDSDTYEKLWARLRAWREETGNDVVTIPHHPAEAMYPFDFAATDYDDDLAPLVETYSQWGSSELPPEEGNPKPIGGIAKGDVGEAGHYAQDALALGNRVGLIASSDFHGPRPGHSIIHVPPHLPRLSEALTDFPGWGLIWQAWNERSYPGGLVAFHAPELTREAIFASLKGRQVYGTTQPHRILVRFAVNGRRLADPESVVTVDARDAERRIEATVAGTAPISRVEVVKNNDVWRTIEGQAGESRDSGADVASDAADDGVIDFEASGLDAYVAEGAWTDDAPVTGLSYDGERGTDDDAYYVRVRQADGGMAWAGPIWASVQ